MGAAWYTWQNALSLALGIAAFVMLLLYDANSIKWRKALLKVLFSVGFIMLSTATALDIWSAVSAYAVKGIFDFVLLGFAVLFLVALIYCLFFALPFRETYLADENGRRVCSSGLYGITRHPGIPIFAGMYLFLGLALLPSAAIVNGMVFSVLNLGYAFFQDNITFPKTFCDYGEYKQSVPFMIPATKSVKASYSYKNHGKEK